MTTPPTDPLPLRDRLALDRTVLANERTLLAHVRTALGLLAAGAGLIHFLDDPVTMALGWTLAGLAPLSLGVGVWRFVRMRARLAADG